MNSKFTIRADGEWMKNLEELAALSGVSPSRAKAGIIRKLVQDAYANKVKEANTHTILRAIEFPPEFKVAGTNLLMYYCDKISRDYSEEDVLINIEQEGSVMRLSIASQSGRIIEEIERDMSDFGYVLKGDLEPKRYLRDMLETIRLENQLQLTKVQIDTERKLLAAEKSQIERRVRSLEEEVGILHNHLGLALQSGLHTARANEVLSSGQSNLSSALADVLAGIYREARENGDQEADSVSRLSKALKETGTVDSTADIEESLRSIKENSPSILEKIRDAALNASMSTAGKLLYDCISRLYA